MLSSDDVETHTREGGFDLCGIAPAEAFPELRFTPRNCTARRLAVTKIAYQGFLFEFSRIVCRRLRCHTRRPSRDAFGWAIVAHGACQGPATDIMTDLSKGATGPPCEVPHTSFVPP